MLVNSNRKLLKKTTFIVVILFMFILDGCTLFAPKQTKTTSTTTKAVRTCADLMIKGGFGFYDKAREFLESYYKSRKESELYFAWYATEDSKKMAQNVGRCPDKRNKHYYALKNLYSKNRIIQRLIAQNMRMPEQMRLAEIFLDQYRAIFPRDIQ